jgi:hypothetical protein
MGYNEEGLVITGSLDDDRWQKILFSAYIGAYSFKNSGYCTLSEFLSRNCLSAEPIIMNGQMAIKLNKVTAPETECSDYTCKCFTTSESKIPQPIAQLGDVQECFAARSLQGIANLMNSSSRVRGENWHVYEGKIMGELSGRTVILEGSFNDAQKINDETLQDLFDKEGIGELYFRNFGKYFALDSDDKKWQALLRKDKFNKVTARNWTDLTPQQWFDEAKSILATYN